MWQAASANFRPQPVRSEPERYCVAFIHVRATWWPGISNSLRGAASEVFGTGQPSRGRRGC